MTRQRGPWPPGPPLGASPQSGQLASVGRRIGGGLIDALVYLPIAAAALTPFLGDLREDPIWRSIEAGTPPDPTDLRGLRGTFLLVGVLAALMFGVYSVLLTKLRGQTLGKMAVGTKVVRVEDGQLPSWGHAIVRWVVPAAANLVPNVGTVAWLLIYLWMIWDPSNQGLHDKAARTLVVRV